MTGGEGREETPRAVAAGMDVVLVKPLGHRALLDALARCLPHEQTVDPPAGGPATAAPPLAV